MFGWVKGRFSGNSSILERTGVSKSSKISHIFLLFTLEALFFTSPLLHILAPPLLFHHDQHHHHLHRHDYDQLGCEFPFPGTQNIKGTESGVDQISTLPLQWLGKKGRRTWVFPKFVPNFAKSPLWLGKLLGHACRINISSCAHKLYIVQNFTYIHSKIEENRFWPIFASQVESWMSLGLTRASEVEMESGGSCAWLMVKPWMA